MDIMQYLSGLLRIHRHALWITPFLEELSLAMNQQEGRDI